MFFEGATTFAIMAFSIQFKVKLRITVQSNGVLSVANKFHFAMPSVMLNVVMLSVCHK
jgi:hypothetical protein